MDGSDSLEGIYKIVVEGFDHENNKVKKIYSHKRSKVRYSEIYVANN